MISVRKLVVSAALVAALPMAAHASFVGYESTVAPTIYFDADAVLDYAPGFSDGLLTDTDALNGDFTLGTSGDGDSTGALDLTTSFLAPVFGNIFNGDLLDFKLTVDNDIGDDTIEFLYKRTATGAGVTTHAIGTFTGDLDTFGTLDFLTDGVLFASGNFKLEGVNAASTSVIPLPATLPLVLAGMGGLAMIGRRRKKA